MSLVDIKDISIYLYQKDPMSYLSCCCSWKFLNFDKNLTPFEPKIEENSDHLNIKTWHWPIKMT